MTSFSKVGAPRLGMPVGGDLSYGFVRNAQRGDSRAKAMKNLDKRHLNRKAAPGQPPKFLRAPASHGDRLSAVTAGLYPFTVTELRQQRKRMQKTRGRYVSRAAAIAACEKIYG